jgi:hypothetical protein
MMNDAGRVIVALGIQAAVALGAATRGTAQEAGARATQGAQEDVAAQVQAQVQQALQQAAQERARARADADQAVREAQQAKEQALREAREAIRQAQIEAARAGRNGRSTVFAQPPFPPMGPQIPEEAVIISIAFFMMCAVIAIGVPIARAIARRMDRKSLAPAGADADTRSRLERIEHAVDAIAVEVERISEGQRFTTKVLADLRALPESDAQPSRRLGNA